MRSPKRAGFAPLGHDDLSRAGEVLVTRLASRHHRLLLADDWAASGGRLCASRCLDCGEQRTVSHVLRGCVDLPAEWQALFGDRSPGWLMCREPHLVVEYLCARGWVEDPRSSYLSASYLSAHPLPPVAAASSSPGVAADDASSSESGDSVVAAVVL
jgi:hypothetical protein